MTIGTLTGSFLNSLAQLVNIMSSIISTNTLLEKYLDVKQIDDKLEHFNLENEIAVNNLTVSYDDKVINYPDLLIKKNHKYIISGKSGTGKTTLINIISGNLNQYDGQIYWDKNDYRNLPLTQLRNSISVMNQSSYIFDTTIKDNIILNRPFDQEKFIKVLSDSQLLDTINSLKDKEETVLDNANKVLSGGQLQRISLARTLYQEKDFIIIDEGTSNLDISTTEMIQQALFSNINLTVIMIIHNLNDYLVNNADEIYEFT